MAWRGLNDKALVVLSDQRIPWAMPQEDKQRLALQATALTHLHRFAEARQALSQVDLLCKRSLTTECGPVLRAHGLFLFENGQTPDAKAYFRQSLEFARSNHDGMLEATALLNLGSVASAEEHHEESLAYYRSSAQKAAELQAADIEQSALGSEGWQQFTLGNSERALQTFSDAEEQAVSLGDTGYAILWLTTSAIVYEATGNPLLAEKSDLQARELARQSNNQQEIINASEELSQVYVDSARPDDADRFAGEALTLAQQTLNRPDILYCHMLQGETATLRHDWQKAEVLLREVILAPESQHRMRWTAEHTLATSYEAQGRVEDAEQAYKAAIALVEAARGDLNQELSRLTFLNNAARIYDDYIHFLVTQGRTGEALEAADWSRARTLQQGLGSISANIATRPPPLRATETARATNTTLLFYWLGERQSYVWAITPGNTTLVALPAKSEIISRIERYRRSILALKDPLRANGGTGDKDGRDLYDILVAPVQKLVAPDRPVVLFTDGELTELNFETLLAGPVTPHYWIEDVTLSTAPSLRLFANKKNSEKVSQERILVIGDSIAADSTFTKLPMAALEIKKVTGDFSSANEVVFSGAQATPRTYLESKPEQFSYIHFVAHATVSKTDPLESAVILSRDRSQDDSYKLYAREILNHPISARLVTISACNSSGAETYAGEGIVGLSWAFLRAGAHNTIGALWDVSDASTPDLMDHLYSGLQQQQLPATALRNAKLALLHSGGNFNRPFYWAPFQLYSGR